MDRYVRRLAKYWQTNLNPVDFFNYVTEEATSIIVISNRSSRKFEVLRLNILPLRNFLRLAWDFTGNDTMIGIEERGKADRKHGRRNHETQQRSGTIGAVGGREGCDAGKRGESAFCKTNEGKVKKYRVRFIKGISWAADSVRIFAIFQRGRKMFNLCPYLSNSSSSVRSNWLRLSYRTWNLIDY